MRVWNRALCQSEIQNNMNCEILTSVSGLLANYHFNQGYDSQNNSGLTALADASGNNNTATLINFALNGASSNWIAPGAVTSGVSCSTFSSTLSVTSTTVTDVSCKFGSNGTAAVTVSGGTSFTYDWIPNPGAGDGTASASGLSVGIYSVVITNECGSTTTKTVSISEPSSALFVSPGLYTNVLCYGANTATASLSISGGSGSYTYSWSPSGGTGATASGLAATNYTCYVKDGNNCVKTAVFNITEPPALILTPLGQNNVTCFGLSNATASVNAASGGVGGYVYDWSPGTPTGEGQTNVSGLAAGTWTCMVTDANNCSISTTNFLLRLG